MYSGYKLLIGYLIYKYFLPPSILADIFLPSLFCELSVHFLGDIIYSTKVLNFSVVQFLCFLSLILLVLYLRNYCSIWSHQNFLLSSKNCVVLALPFRSMIHLELIFVNV